MLDLKYVTENLAEVRTLLAAHGFEDQGSLDRLQVLSLERKEVIQSEETLRAERNEVSKALGQIKDKKSADFLAQRERMKGVGEQIKALEEKHKAVDAEIRNLLLHLPNIPHETTPRGKDENENVEIRTVGEKPTFEFEPKDHVEIGEALGLVDFERGAKISGSRFSVLKGAGSQLARALMMFMLDMHTTDHGYTEVWPPAIVKDSALLGTSQLPKFATDVFKIATHEEWDKHNEAHYDLYLSPTAEVQVTNLHSNEILANDQLPIAYTAYSACFRSEAGSYGRDTRGLIRQHQFDKVEMVRFCRPEEGEKQLELLTEHAENVLNALQLHYRTVQLCSGDMGFAAAKAFDVEVWLPSQNTYREISSCSWCTEFQARRANIRFRRETKSKPEFVHTINGSGLAIGRTLIAIVEQFQQADGSVSVPKVLRPYMRGLEKIA